LAIANSMLFIVDCEDEGGINPSYTLLILTLKESLFSMRSFNHQPNQLRNVVGTVGQGIMMIDHQ